MKQRKQSIERIETRPATTEEQKSEGILALRALALRDRRNGGALLGSAPSQEFVERGGTELVGAEARTPHDLANAAQIQRDPRFETFWFFFTKNGKIARR